MKITAHGVDVEPLVLCTKYSRPTILGKYQFWSFVLKGSLFKDFELL